MCTYQLPKVSARDSTYENCDPLNIGRVMIFDENQKIYGLVIKAETQIGALRKISELAEKLNIIIRYIQFSMTKIIEPSVTAIAFLDFSKSNVSPEEALKLVKKLEFVKMAKLIKPHKKGIIFDDYFFPLNVGEERAVIFRKTVYEALMEGVREKFGSAGEAILYYIGFTIGYQVCDRNLKIAHSKDAEDLINLSKAMFKTFGYGIIDNAKIDFKEARAQLRIHHNFECGLGKNNGKPHSQFVRGILAGFFTQIFGKSVNAQETKCLAKGNSYCEFTIK